MTSAVILVGAGGLGRETAEAAAVAGHDVLGFVDDDAARWGEVIDGGKVLGGLDTIHDYPDARLVICVGKGIAREAIAARLGVSDSRYATVVHPAAVVPASAAVGAGSIVLAGAVLTASVTVGRHVVVMPHVTLTHDDVADDFATLCAGVTLGGAVHVGAAAYVGMQASIRERCRVGARSVVGAASVVLATVPDGEVWHGVPARREPQPPVRNRVAVPLVDLSIQHAEITADIAAGFDRVLRSGAFVLGPDVAAFEEEFAAYCGAAECVGVANGTDALELALRAVGVRAGDEVILPANTFVATAGAVMRAGATPVLVDCDPEFLLLDPALVEERITPRTRAVVPVHLYGQLAPMEPILEIARSHGLRVVEDAAQAHGADRHGRRSGAWGDAAATSFYPGKNLGAYGDGGAVLTASDQIGESVRRLRNHGGTAKYEHAEPGFNSRLDTLQAVVLRAKLRRLDGWNQQRRAAADRYTDLLTGVPGVVLPATADQNRHVWHLYVVRVDDRDRVLGELNAAGIGAGIHYPVPLHLQPAYRHLGNRPGDFPVAEAAAGRLLSLPIYPGITAEQQERVAGALACALGRSGRRR